MSNSLLDEYLERPDDDELAFVHFEAKFRAQRDRALRETEERGDSEHFVRSYINHILATVRALELALLERWVNNPKEAGRSENYREIQYDIDGTVVEIKVRHSILARKTSIKIDRSTKESIRDLVTKIKAVIESDGVALDRRERLMKRLNAFTMELDRTRTPMAAFADLAIEAAGVAGEVEAKLRPVRGWIDSIAGLLRAAKVFEEDHPALPPPPRKLGTVQPEMSSQGSSKPSLSWDAVPRANLDDDIPF